MYARDHALIATPFGPIRIEGHDDSISRIHLAAAGSIHSGETAAVRAAAEQTDAYFSGNLNDFCLPLARVKSPRGQILREGPIAVRYGELARRLGDRATLRATGPRLSSPAIAFSLRAGHWVPIWRATAPPPSNGCSIMSGATF